MLPVGSVAASDCLRRIDVSGIAGDAAALGAAVAAAASASRLSLSPGAGTMLQAVWFDAGAERSGRLLLTIHHLSVDGVRGGS